MLTASWKFLEPDLPSILNEEPNPIESLAEGNVPALIVRGAFPRDECRSLVQHLIAEELMFESGDPRISSAALSPVHSHRWLRPGLNPQGSSRQRIDIGASLANFGDDEEDFFRRSAETHDLFARLFSERPNPIDVMYGTLAKLATNKRVATAHEPDGRLYGPAIFRIHYGGYTYGPHFDSVRNRKRRSNYAVYKYERQLAGVLCLQNATAEGVSAQCLIHRQFWNPELDPLLKSGDFGNYAARNNVERVRVDLEPGDLYLFNTGMIHEVPGVAGDLPRIVLATFIGYSPSEPEIMVWS